jgi:hypothetical protein
LTATMYFQNQTYLEIFDIYRQDVDYC